MTSCQGASWSKAGRQLRGGLDGERDLEPRGSPVSGHRLLIVLHLVQCGMLIKGRCSPLHTVIQYSSTSYSSVFLLWSMLSGVRIPSRSLPCSRSECGSFREVNTALNARLLYYHSSVAVQTGDSMISSGTGGEGTSTVL